MKPKTVTCQINFHQDYLETDDLDSTVHEGFTIGKGKTMYWYIIWHRTGHCTVARNANDGTLRLIKRYIPGDSEITIHWKH